MNAALQRKRLHKTALSLRHPLYRTALRHRVLPAVEHEAVLATLGSISSVIDVGANVGQFAVVARRCFPAATIVSFEPLPGPRKRLQILFAGDAAFSCSELALADVAGPVPFHVAGADDSSSLLRVAARQVEEFPGTRCVETVTVQAERLDRVLEERAELPGALLLKLDTQGSELAVLRGAECTLARVTALIVEVSFVGLYEGQGSTTEVVRFLLDHGFGLAAAYDVKSSRRTGEPIQCDLAFVRAGGPGP